MGSVFSVVQRNLWLEEKALKAESYVTEPYHALEFRVTGLQGYS